VFQVTVDTPIIITTITDVITVEVDTPVRLTGSEG
jgi:hypothetical protein